MPRVPVLTEQRVSTAPLSLPQVRPIVSTGLGSIGAGLSQAGGAAQRIAAQAQDDADRFRAAQLKLEAGKAINDASYGPDGFLLQDGENAFAYEERLSKLQETLRGIGQGAATPRQRQLFALDMGQRLLQVRSSWSRHADGQRDRLYGEIAKGVAGQAVEAARLNYSDADAIDAAIQGALVDPDGEAGPVIRDLRNRGAPKEAIDAAVGALKAKVYATALDGYLGAEDLAGAKAYLDRVRGDLGGQASRYEKEIGRGLMLRRAGEKARGLVAGHTDKAGILDSTAALSAFEQMSFRTEDERKATEDALGDAIRLHVGATEAEAKEINRVVGGSYNTGGHSFSKLLRQHPKEMARLNELRPDLYRWYQEDAEARARRWKAEHDGDKGVSKEKSDLDRIAEKRFLALPLEERAQIDLHEFALRPDSRVGSDLGFATLQQRQRQAIEALGRGGSARERNFVQDAEIRAAGLPAFSGTTASARKKASENKTDLRAAAALAYEDFVRKNQREPSDQEQQQILDFLLTKQTIEEHWYGDKEQFGFEQVQQQAVDEQATAPAATTQQQPQHTEAERRVRLKQLVLSGKTDAEIAAILTQEGY